MIVAWWGVLIYLYGWALSLIVALTIPRPYRPWWVTDLLLAIMTVAYPIVVFASVVWHVAEAAARNERR